MFGEFRLSWVASGQYAEKDLDSRSSKGYWLATKWF